MTEDRRLAEQLAYYRRRAPEYDATSYGDLNALGGRIHAILDELRPAGRLLEIACGTGLWTQHLLDRATSITALDAAAEMLAAARQRLNDPRVHFVHADVFSFVPTEKFDTVFFAAWLSHVPDDRLAEFWSMVASALADDGRVLFVDESERVAGKEHPVSDAAELVTRKLRDGSTHRVVKVFRSAAAIEQRLADLGWEANVHEQDGDWVMGEARPSG